MIDHVSIGVHDLEASGRFYDAVLPAVGHKRLVTREGAIGYGKNYPEFWLNERRAMAPVGEGSGAHVCLRAADTAAVEAFHAAALQAGGRSDGKPGPRPLYSDSYYAAYVLDPDGNRIEAVTFTSGGR